MKTIAPVIEKENLRREIGIRSLMLAIVNITVGAGVFVIPAIVAIAFYALLGFILAASGGFKQLAVIASAAILIVYLGVILATLKSRVKKTVADQKAFHGPGGIIVPLLAIAGIIWLLSSLSRTELIGIGTFVLIFAVLYIIVNRFRSNVR